MKKMKSFKLTPEWVLENLPDMMYADGNGIITLSTEKTTDDHLMRLALNTLKIPYKEFKNVNMEDISIWYEFKIDDIKIDCPSLYLEMMEMNSPSLEYKLNRNIDLN